MARRSTTSSNQNSIADSRFAICRFSLPPLLCSNLSLSAIVAIYKIADSLQDSRLVLSKPIKHSIEMLQQETRSECKSDEGSTTKLARSIWPFKHCEKRIATLAILTLLFLLQYNMLHELLCVHETSRSNESPLLQAQRQQPHQHLAESYRHDENSKNSVQSSRSINTTSTVTKQHNPNSNSTDHSIDDQTSALPNLPNEQQHEGNNLVVLYSSNNNKTNTSFLLSDPFLQQMLLDENRQRLQFSAGHQQKFVSHKSSLRKVFPLSALYHSVQGPFAAVALDDNRDWAYIHIWKSGGTTIEKQTGRAQTGMRDPTIQRRERWMTLVRDPFDHFLSGWAECGMRFSLGRPWHNMMYEFDGRIREHMNETRTTARNLRSLDSLPPSLRCTSHSFPQANFLLHKGRGHVDDRLQVIGDLREMVHVLQLVGFAYNATIGTARRAEHNECKRKFFPVQKDLLSNETIKEICNFVAIDYYLFDFPPPPACDGMFRELQQH
jgi:hypothetical protein